MTTKELLGQIIGMLAAQKASSDKEDEILDRISSAITEASEELNN